MSRPVLAIGPANYAGQAHRWVHAATAFLPADGWSFTRGPVRRGEFLFDADFRISAPSYYFPLAHHTRLERLFRNTTHIALDGFQPFFTWHHRGSAPKDARWLQDHGWTTALIAHGTDVRDPAAHLERNQFSLFSTGDDQWRARLQKLTIRNRAEALDSGLPLFVSTPDLLHDLPEATWLPLTVKVADWVCDRAPFEAKVPTVLHVPSRRHPPIKGTQFVDPVCKCLEARGLIRYLSPETIAHARMPELVRQSDIVIDQLLSASYGVAAAEAMAAGRLVLGYVGETTRAMMPEDPPLVDITPNSLEEALLQILNDPEEPAKLAAQGPGFINRWHSGQAAAERLQGFLHLDC